MKFTMTWLVRDLSRVFSDCEFVLVTSEQNHDELPILDSRNVRRLCVSRWTRPSALLSSRLRPITILPRAILL